MATLLIIPESVRLSAEAEGFVFSKDQYPFYKMDVWSKCYPTARDAKVYLQEQGVKFYTQSYVPKDYLA